ncbi:hypothetical protein HNV12_11755 [Methanococcoides sp. SA1]|nr:hypothetical protein [Methanococcoides sp. SA1]
MKLDAFYRTFCKYCLFPFVAYTLISCFLVRIGVWQSDLGSAQYLISALIQGEAAILAIIISISIFAVNNSQSYSPRIVDIFLNKDRNPYFWSVVVLYIFALIFGISVLKTLHASESYKTSNLQTSIWILYFLGIHAFVILTVYISEILMKLKPSGILTALSDSLDTKDLLIEDESSTDIRHIATDFSLPNDSNFQPMRDIIRTSIINSDNETAILGMKLIEEKITHLINEKYAANEIIRNKLSIAFYEQFSILGKFCIEKNNDVSTSQVTKLISTFGVNTFKIEDNDLITGHMMPTLLSIGKIAIDNNNNESASQTIKSIVAFGIETFDTTKDTELLKCAISPLKNLTESAITNGDEDTARLCIESIGVLKNKVPESDNLDFFKYLLPLIEEIGKFVIRSSDLQVSLEIPDMIESFAITDDIEFVKHVILRLEALANYALFDEKDAIASSFVDSIEMIISTKLTSDNLEFAKHLLSLLVPIGLFALRKIQVGTVLASVHCILIIRDIVSDSKIQLNCDESVLKLIDDAKDKRFFSIIMQIKEDFDFLIDIEKLSDIKYRYKGNIYTTKYMISS